MNYINNFLLANRFNLWLADIFDSFYKTFIYDDRWLRILKGLGRTILITVVAAIIGIILGFIVAAIRSTYDKNLANKKCRKFGDYILKIANSICNVYLTVIRGTPAVTQLMIIYYIVFASARNGMYAAFVAFGINSGAYVAEIVRSGIMSIDKGQFEAGRSLGMNYVQTMWHIVFPQAFKNILPALGNEFIVLLKETSIAGYVTIEDLSYAVQQIRSRTYEPFFPLIAVALIYLAMVMLLTHFLKKLERRLRDSDH